jgi:hypothetical protein
MNRKMGTKRKSIPPDILKKLWIKAGGRCEYEGCNKLLYRDSLTEQEMNTAYISHIVSARPNGLRGDAVLSPKLQLDLGNLMLLCDECHRRIDKEQLDKHPVELLTGMKKKHEERIERVTGIRFDQQSHIIIYTAKVGNFEVTVSHGQAVYAIMPERFPVNDRPVFLGIQNGIEQDNTPQYWDQQSRQLEGSFNKLVTPLFDHDNVKDFSVFSFAPQPLLIKLGTLLSDKSSIKVFQYHRYSSSWRWGSSASVNEYLLLEPSKAAGIPALVFSLSGSINKNDIIAILGTDCNIWEITVNAPFNDYLRTKELLSKFREITRYTIDKIKQVHGCTLLHIFPAMPVAAAVEFGRLWMPKADMPLIIYDYNIKTGGFIKAIEIKSN